MVIPDTLRPGRESFERKRWTEAYTRLSEAERAASLDPDDLERLATAAYLIGKDAESTAAWGRAHQEYLKRDAMEPAIRCAFWLAFGLLQKGEHARGAGWLSRAQRMLDDCGEPCVEEGYLLLPVGLGHIFAGDAANAYTTFCRAAEIADRFGDPDLTALARHSRGRALLRMGEIDRGVALLDEAMVDIEADDVSPLVVGDVYCSVVEGCVEIFDLGRAQEWTEALTEWCESQPDLVPYRGQCLVRRAEIMQLHGEWPEAMREARQACARLSGPPAEPAAGSAFYQKAELHRLRGEFPDAEEAFRQASQWGRNPQPGLAQLRLAEGRIDAAEAAVRRVMDEAKDRVIRCRVLPVYIEVMLAADDIPAARTAADDLAAIADESEAPFLRAVAARARGAVLLAEGDHRGAIPELRRAWTTWEELEAPYEAARVRVLLGVACREVGDEDSAEMDIDAARRVFRELGAAPDLAMLDARFPPAAAAADHGLTSRELEVLRLVAAGKPNKDVAAQLFISERTVERHVSNIFNKIGVSSRAAATAYAYEHGLA